MTWQTYWPRRANREYHAKAMEFVRQYIRHSPLEHHQSTLLDVGGGIQYGCRYLDGLPEFDRTSIELPDSAPARLAGVRLIADDFRTWTPDRRYDVVTCLQVLEHIPDAAAFAQQLFACATQLVVISVPFKWKRRPDSGHIHDPVDRAKLATWTGREPLQSKIVDQATHRRLVAIYRAEA